MDVTPFHNQTAVLQRHSSRNDDGDPTYGSKITIKCHVEHSTQVKEFYRATELDEFSKLSTTTEVGVNDRIWPPGTDSTDEDAVHIVNWVKKAYDLDGNFIHYVVRY